MRTEGTHSPDLPVTAAVIWCGLLDLYRESCVLKLPPCPPHPTAAVMVANFGYMFAQDEAYFGGAYMQPAPPGMAPPYPTYPPPPRKWPA